MTVRTIQIEGVDTFNNSEARKAYVWLVISKVRVGRRVTTDITVFTSVAKADAEKAMRDTLPNIYKSTELHVTTMDYTSAVA